MKRITEAQLAEWEALAAAATAGPWYPRHRGLDADHDPEKNASCGLGWQLTIGESSWDSAWPEPMRGTFERGYDAHFVAASREAVPALVTEVRRLQQVIRMAVDALLVQVPPTIAGEPEAEAEFWRSVADIEAGILAEKGLGEVAGEMASNAAREREEGDAHESAQ